MTEKENMRENYENRYIRGTILYTIFQNENENFSIVKIKIDGTNETYDEKEIVIKGHLPPLKDGSTYTFYGEMENHPKFGRQYKVHSYQSYIPTDREGLIAYLSSDLFYGVGKKTATRIVETLGVKAVEKILDDPEVVYEVPRLPKNTAKNIIDTLQENQGFEKIVIELSKFGIGMQLCQKIYQAYKHEAIPLLQDNPYQYVFDIEGFSFHMAENIAEKHTLSNTHPDRIKAACIHVLNESIQEGHVYLPLDECIEKMTYLLSTKMLSEDEMIAFIKEMDQEKKIIVHEKKVYLPSLYYAEEGFASHIKRILSENEIKTIDQARLMHIIGEIEETESLSYGAEQFEAIQKALQTKMMIVTGGPGTGKTTVIKGILKAYAKIHEIPYDKEEYEDPKDYPFLLAAPTGRAAQRLSESTDLKATTIHRLLGWNGEDVFERDEHDPLEGRYLVVDEFSMVDIWLANRLFKAIPKDMQVLIIGDEDQLPSVGPGQVLSDLLNSYLLPSVRLHEVYRQKEGSKIIKLAHKIKNNECEKNDLTKSRDFSFISCHEQQVVDVIIEIFKRAKDRGLDLRDIQVLAPMYRTKNGIHTLNKELQKIVNPPSSKKRETRFQDVIFRVGDRVIQLVNQPEDGISNGDIGEIIAIFKPRENKEKVEQMIIAFGDKEIVYERQDYIHIMHAFCISIHKSQGSEFPNVILPVVSTYRRMLKKNLLYTAVTRSKDSLIICGEKRSFLQGIETLDHHKRYSTLQEQLMIKMEEKNYPSITSKKQEVEEVTPYDFL